MKIPNFVKVKAIPTMLPVNVRNIMPRSENVTATIITSNVTPKHGVNKTGITQPLVLFQNMWISPVRVTALCINNVKPIINVPAVIPVIQTLVLPARNSKRTPDVVLMILLTELVAVQADVRATLQPIRHPTAPMARMAVNILVIIPVI